MANVQGKNIASKVKQESFGLSLKSSASSKFPIIYAEDLWDVVEATSELGKALGVTGEKDSYTQHDINEALVTAAGKLPTVVDKVLIF